MERQFLKGLGISDEAIEKVMAEYGKDVGRAKDDADKLTTERDGLKSQLEEANKTIKGLKDQDPDGLFQKVKEWEKKYKDDTDALNAKLLHQILNSRVDMALVSHKAKNVKAVRALLDLEKISMEGDTVKGLDDQLEAVAKDNPYLFEEMDSNPKPGAGGTVGTDETNLWRAEAGLPNMNKE